MSLGADPLAIGLDLGTSGLKGVAITADGRVVAEARAGYPTSRPSLGASEQDASDWLDAARSVLLSLAADTDASSWIGIGLSGMLPTLVTVDSSGRAVGAAITWEDNRAEDEGSQLVALVGADELYAATGQLVDGRYLLPMFLRICRLDPSRAAVCELLLGAKDYLLSWLTGVVLTDPSTAAGYGCFDLLEGSWSAEVLAAAATIAGRALPSLPDVADARSSRPLRSELAAELDLPAGLPVAVGGADSVLGLLGLGLREPGEVAYLAGTSTVILAVSAELRCEPGQPYLVTPLAGMPGWGLEMDLLATGSALRWLADLVGAGDLSVLLDTAGEVAPENAPVLLPYVAPGEQGALWDSTLAGTLFGLTLHHDRRHLVRALLTGIVLESRRCFDVLAATAGPGDVWVGGGGSAHPRLLADLAAASGRTVRTSDDSGSDYSAIGAALLVLPESATDRRPATSAVAPDPVTAELWAGLAAKHEAALRSARTYYGSAS